MNISIKNFDVKMEIKNKGIELDVYDANDNHLGDLVITKSKLIWCRGRTDRNNGIPVKWEEFIKYMEEE